ncbi:actin binding protein [Microbotryomycetes sp. JL201]|nr:actin binding protein [Microbotryomycetes sp. JL201]
MDDPDAATDYALYTLVTAGASSNELKLVDSGSGGLDELEDQFADGKVMWAFVRVKDPGSGLPKFVLINWLGEGVPESKKGLFPSHSAAVAKFLKG